MDMCQDVDYLVRRCMCEQVGAIGRVAGRDLLLRDMLGELFELLRDEELQVGWGVGEVYRGRVCVQGGGRKGHRLFIDRAVLKGGEGAIDNRPKRCRGCGRCSQGHKVH